MKSQWFPDKLRAGSVGKEGAVKCILSQDKWVTPIEFEALGGKSKSGKWKQSIRTENNVILSSFLLSKGLDLGRQSLPSSQDIGVVPQLLIDQILAYVKAHHFRYDSDSLNPFTGAGDFFRHGVVELFKNS